MDTETLFKGLAWLVVTAAGGIIGNAGYAALKTVLNSTRSWLTTRQSPPSEIDARFSERLAADQQRLIIFLGVIVLSVLAMICVGGVTLMLALMNSLTHSFLYWAPLVANLAAFYFCTQGFKFLGRVTEQLNQRDQEILARTN
jgi:protein-S-isoprenylcysteine O-methyltransferase Ste14